MVFFRHTFDAMRALIACQWGQYGFPETPSDSIPTAVITQPVIFSLHET